MSRPDLKARVRFYFHHYVLFGSQSEWERHQAAVAAHNQGMEHFWAMHDYIYQGMVQEPSQSYVLDDLREFAKSTLGLDINQFEADLYAEETISFLNWEHDQGEAGGVSGTPSVFLCGEKINRSEVEELLDAYLGTKK